MPRGTENNTHVESFNLKLFHRILTAPAVPSSSAGRGACLSDVSRGRRTRGCVSAGAMWCWVPAHRYRARRAIPPAGMTIAVLAAVVCRRLHRQQACGPISSSVGLCGPAIFSPKAPARVRGSMGTVSDPLRPDTGRDVAGRGWFRPGARLRPLNPTLSPSKSRGRGGSGACRNWPIGARAHVVEGGLFDS